MTKLYVGNLPDNAKDKDIRELFQSFGEVEEVALLRGYGFVVSTCTNEFACTNYHILRHNLRAGIIYLPCGLT